MSSDLRRATDSARIIADAFALPLVLDDRLREMSFGEWDGRTWEEIDAADGHRLRAWMEDWTHVAPPGGESLDAFAQRVARVIAEVRSGVIVSHAGWIRVATSLLLGEPLASMFDRTIEYAHAAVFEHDGTRYRLLAFNTRFDTPESGTWPKKCEYQG